MEKKYYKHKIENLLVISKIITIHDFEFHKDFVGPSESHDFWELVYALKGGLICRAGDREVTLSQGEMLFHKPNEIHSLRADGVHAPDVFIISFECKSEAIHFFEDRRLQVDKNLLRFVFSIIEESKKTFSLPYADPDLLKMELLPVPALGGQQLIKNYLEILLISLMRNETECGVSDAVFLPREQYDEMISSRVITYMQEHLSENLTIDDICAVLHYNRSYIFKQFKKTTGTSIMAYFNKLKINRAKQLLRESELSISQISESLAFQDPNYFSRSFKKATGFTPSAYRKRAILSIKRK